ncbi:unnamed protein product, partial [Prorocentrum cordatum]
EALALPSARKAAEEDEEPPLLCRFPDIEPPGPQGDSASAVAARHMIVSSGCESWFRQVGAGEWEEVLRFWPPPADVSLARAPKLKRESANPYGLRGVAPGRGGGGLGCSDACWALPLPPSRQPNRSTSTVG